MQVFPLELKKKMDQKYPGVLTELANNPGGVESCLAIAAKRKVDPLDRNIMAILSKWMKYKACYNFEEQLALDLLNHVEEPTFKIPIQSLKHIPFPCMAWQLVPGKITIAGITNVISGNVFIYLEGSTLFALWELDNGRFCPTSLYLEEDFTIKEWGDILIAQALNEAFDRSTIDKMMDVFGIEHLYNTKSFEIISDTESRRKIDSRFGNGTYMKFYEYFLIGINRSYLLHRTIYVILYMNCTNADIENCQERLRKGAWASLLSSQPTDAPIPRTQRRQALRENEGVSAYDVGYKVVSEYKKGLQETSHRTAQAGTGKQHGYELRRAHFHHFWCGPKNGVLAADFSNPKPYERYLKLRWVSATEIHPELKDDAVRVIPVNT